VQPQPQEEEMDERLRSVLDDLEKMASRTR
jgi:hypothetical protein